MSRCWPQVCLVSTRLFQPDSRSTVKTGTSWNRRTGSRYSPQHHRTIRGSKNQPVNPNISTSPGSCSGPLPALSGLLRCCYQGDPLKQAQPEGGTKTGINHSLHQSLSVSPRWLIPPLAPSCWATSMKVSWFLSWLRLYTRYRSTSNTCH